MWRRRKSKNHDKRENPFDALPIPSLDKLESMVSEGLSVITHLKNFVGNIPIESEAGRRALKDLVSRLSSEFPVEFVLMTDDKPLSADYPIAMQLRKDLSGGFTLLMKHQARYSGTQTLPEAILFLLRAKMIETGFPGIMLEGDKRTRDVYAEIAYQLKEPTFPGQETPYFGRIYPYPVYRINKEAYKQAWTIYEAIRKFYELELLARTYPTPIIGGELYEAFLLGTLLPPRSKSWNALLDEVAVATAEDKLNYGQRHAFLPQFSSQLEKLIEIYGATLFLKALQRRWGENIVFVIWLTIKKLPLENGEGFSRIHQDIDKIFRKLFVILKGGYSRDTIEPEEVERLRSMLVLRGEYGGLRGNIKLKKNSMLIFS